MWGNKTQNVSYLLLQDTLAMDTTALTLMSVKWIMEAVVSLHWCSASTFKYSNWFLVCSCYSMVTFTKSPSFYMTIFIMNPTNLMALLPQSHDCSWCISRWIVAPSPLWLQKHTDVCSLHCTYSSNLYRRPRLTILTFTWRLGLCGIAHAITNSGLQHVRFL